VKRERLNANIGKRDLSDKHPLITCAPHIKHGHAHLGTSGVTLERVHLALMKERRGGPLTLEPAHNGTEIIVTDEEVKAVYRYTIDVFQTLSRLYAELDRMRRLYEGMSKGTPKARS
jgi:hypothetical protein